MSWAAAFARRHGLSPEATAELLGRVEAPRSGVWGEAVADVAAVGGPQTMGLLGRGATAEVHRAHDDRLDRVVAMKVLRPELRGDPAAASRFQHGCRVAKPGVEQPVEFVIGYKVIRERSILGTQLLCSRLRLLGMPFHIELLVMGRSLK